MDKLNNHDEIVELIRKGSRIDAIKLVRETSGKSLRECKEYIEAAAKGDCYVGNRNTITMNTVKDNPPVREAETKTKTNLIVRCPACGCAQIITENTKILGLFKKEIKKCTICKRKF